MTCKDIFDLYASDTEKSAEFNLQMQQNSD